MVPISDRIQVVNIGKTISDPLNVTCGVLQGSLLGPLLFVCYINDMELSVDSDCKLLLYAGDSAIILLQRSGCIAQKLDVSGSCTYRCMAC